MARRALSVIAVGALFAVSFATAAAGAGERGAVSNHRAMVEYVRAHGYIPIGGPAAYARYSAAAAANAARLQPGRSPARPASADTPVASPSWQGVDENDLAPPDSTGAVGPGSYIEFINNQVAIYRRTGKLVASAGTEVLFGGAHLDYSDPQVLWDPATNRFYLLVLNTSDDTFAWGFSKARNPTSVNASSFCTYVADFGYGSNLPDYPKLGQTTDFLLIGANIYANLATFLGADIDWIAKPQSKGTITTCPAAGSFLQGKRSGILNADGVTLASTPEPGVQADPSSTGWVVAVPDSTNSGATGTELELYKVTKNPDGTANIPSVATAVPVAMYSPPSPAPQMGSVHTIDTLDGRLTHAVAAVDPAHGAATALWTSHAVFGGAGSEERWYEIDVAQHALFQSGVATSATLYVFNGGVAPDRVVRGNTTRAFGSNMVMGFTTSSAASFPAIQMVSKVGVNPQSSFVLVKQSPGADDGFDCFELQRCRWGDYSGATPDPAASPTASTGKVWLSNMWASGQIDPLNATWRTWNWGATP